MNNCEPGALGHPAFRGYGRTVRKPQMADEEELSQSDKFKAAARELECDDNEARFNERVKALVKHKPVEKPE